LLPSDAWYIFDAAPILKAVSLYPLETIEPGHQVSQELAVQREENNSRFNKNKIASIYLNISKTFRTESLPFRIGLPAMDLKLFI
jgi:hypothetical protein